MGSPDQRLIHQTWQKTGGNRPLNGFANAQDAISYSRQNPTAGNMEPPYDAGCIDPRVIKPNGVLRAAAADVFSKPSGLLVVQDRIQSVGHHPSCGKTAAVAAENGVTDEINIDALAKRGAELLGNQLGVPIQEHTINGHPSLQPARGLVVDATPYGFDPSLVVNAKGKQVLPPVLTFNAGVLGPESVIADGPLAMDLPFGPKGFGNEYFGPENPVLVFTVFDSSNHRGSRLDPDHALAIAEELASQHPGSTELHVVDLSKSPSTTKIIT